MDKYYLLKNHNYVRKLVLDGFDSVTIFFHPFVPFSWIENLFSFLSISMRQMIKALALDSLSTLHGKATALALDCLFPTPSLI